MPDDSEDIYVPTGPNDLDQETNIQELRRVHIESKESHEKSKTDTEYTTLVPSESYRPFTAGNLEDPTVKNLNYKDVFPELNLEELPPQIKYKLPVSEHYDPEGKMVEQRGVLNKSNIVTYEKMMSFHKDRKDISQNEEFAFKNGKCDKSIIGIKEVDKEHKHLNILEEESNLRRIKQTALHVIEDSLSKAVSVANQSNYKTDVSLNETLQYEVNKKIQKYPTETEKRVFEQSNIKKVNSEAKKVSFKDDHQVHEIETLSSESSKREVRVADEIKKFETFDIQMDSKLNEEERKLITRQDIEEAIEAGTVRQRTGMFKTGTDRIVENKFDKRILETARSNIKTNIDLAKEKAYNIGLHVIPRISNAVQYSKRSSLMLKKFLLQMTKVMITLYRFIPIEKIYSFTRSRELYEGNHEYIQKLNVNDEAFRRDMFMDDCGGIRKPKLSGAKIAQIEGLKPVELTDRMNIVISEFLRKTGKEEITDEREFHRRQKSSSKNESTSKNELRTDTSFTETTYSKSQTGRDFSNETPFREKTFDKSQSEDEFWDGSSLKNKVFDSKKLIEEINETKTQSFETKEKRHSEYSKFNSFETESKSMHDVSTPLTYIAIVEAHVYTNKNAIFEEQMRRMSESMKQSDVTESSIIYYRCEVSVFYRHFREPSLPPTVVIESIEEIPSEQVFEEEKQEILQESSTIYEDTAKRVAVQKISEVIEPLLKIKEVRSVNIKQAYSAVERSVKSVVETSEIKEEEKSGFVKILETDKHKPRPIIEPTTKSIAETTEIFIEEETVGMVDVPQPISQLPHPVKVERTVKSVAEISEVIVDEANVEILDVTKTVNAAPRCTIADNLRSIAETMVAIITEPKSESVDVVRIKEEKVSVGVDEIIASEVFEIFPEEPVYEEVIYTETKRRQSDVFLEKSLLVLPEITLTAAEEPICEELIVSKPLSKEANIDVIAKVVAEITEVSLSEKEQDSFEVVKITANEHGALKKESVLSVGETETILPFEPPPEIFDPNKVISQQALIAITETMAIETIINEVEEPKEKNVDILDFIEKQAQASIEDKLLAVAETVYILPEEPIVAFQLNQDLKQQAHIEVMELKTATVNSVSIEEPKQQIIETPKVRDKEPNTAMETSLLSVAENTITLTEGPHHGYLEIPNIEIKVPKTLIECGLVVAETIEVTPTSPEGGFNLIETINKQAHVSIEESKAISTSLVHLEEPREEKLEFVQFQEKIPQISLQDTLLTVPTAVKILPEGPSIENFITPKIIEEKADIDIEELKTASVTVVSVEEPKNENIDNFTYSEKESDFLLEKPVLNAAEIFTIVPEGPFYGKFESPVLTCDKANIILGEIKPLTISIVTPNEPQEKAVDVPQVKDIKPQLLIEDRFLPVVETILVALEESKIEPYAVTKSIDKQANINIEVCETAETTIITIGEPKEENLKSPILETKQHQPVVEAVHLAAAETSRIFSEESTAIFDVAKTTSQQANIEVIEQKAAETSIMLTLESRQRDVVIPEVIEKTPQTVFEKPVLTAAKNYIIVSEEKVDELQETIKPVGQRAIVCLEGLKLADTIILFSEEPTPDNVKVLKQDSKQPRPKAVDKYFVVAEIIFILPYEPKEEILNIPKSLSYQAKFGVVESTALAVANVTSVTVSVSKEEIVDVSKYTVELAEGYVEEEAALVVTVDLSDIDLSSVSSTISSAPSSPLIQEYIFGVATGHEYRVQSPQETSLDIKQSAKEFYGVDNADTSYTLTFEAAYEDENEILHMEEFSDIVKKNHFWISDIKTMETVESSDAKMQLMNVSMSAMSDARQIQSKHNSIQDSTVGIKSRSQSFDASADFEVSLQSSEQSKARETQFSDVQAAITFDLKSEASFKTVADVESQAIVNIKSKAAKTYSAQSVDVAYGLTIENEIEVNGQSMELDVQASQDTNIAKSIRRRVKKGAKGYLESSETDIEANYNYEVGMNLESRSISKESLAAKGGSLESCSISEANYLALEGKHESSRVSKESFAIIEGNLDSSRVSEANYLAMKDKLESSESSKSSSTGIKANLQSSSNSHGYIEMDASLESRSVSKESNAAIEAASVSESSYSTIKAILESNSSREMDARQKMCIQKDLTEISQDRTKIHGHDKLFLETGTKTHGFANFVKSPSPEDIPSTPLRDEYIFRLLTPTPEETTFIPRDCSFTPESVHDEPLVIVNGMIPHIDTKIVRVLYSPPLDTPPTSPWRKVEPVFTKPGLKGGSETSEFTKEEILEIGRKSALLASAIDKTIRSIEEYKESVGIGDKKEITGIREERKINEQETLTKTSVDNENFKRVNGEENKITENKDDQSNELDVRKSKKSSKNMQLLSRFSQI